MNVYRTRSALEFLSLECVTGLQDLLWVPVREFVTLQNLLRGELSHCRSTTDGGRFYWNTMRQIIKYFGAPTWLDLQNWIDNVYIQGGSDRFNELVWESTLFRYVATYPTSADWLHRMCAAMKSAGAQHASTVSDRLAQRSEWDVLICGDGYDYIESQVINILSANTFIKAWHLFRPQTFLNPDQETLFSYARALTEGRQMESEWVVFPDTWTHDVPPLFRKFIRMQLE